MTDKSETKHERFLRLAQSRLGRAKEQLRLVSQLASRDYESHPDEAEEVVQHLDEDVRHIAQVFGVEYATRIGKAGTRTTNGARAIGFSFRKAPVLDEIECVKALEHLRAGRIEEVERRLRAAIRGKDPA